MMNIETHISKMTEIISGGRSAFSTDSDTIYDSVVSIAEAAKTALEACKKLEDRIAKLEASSGL